MIIDCRRVPEAAGLVRSRSVHGPTPRLLDMEIAGARIFAVESWGSTGTHWLAHALDSHPQIRCFHAMNGTAWRMTGGRRLDGVEYAEMLAAQRLGYPVVGDVHGFARTSIAEVKRELGDLFRSAVLVRDPIARYRSQLGLFRHGEWRRWATNGRLWNIDYVKPIARDAGIELKDDYDQMLVVHAACMLNVILEELALGLGPVVRMEDVVSIPEVLLSLVSTLTADEVDSGRSWAEQAVGGQPLERHARGEALTPHELDVLERIVKPEAWEAYRRLGYSC